MFPLSREERRELLAIARRAISEATLKEREWLPPLGKGALAELCGAFVTLERRGRLRGCVGHPEPAEPLAHTVARCAVLAAREDHRFSAVDAAEIAELEIEISALSALAPIAPEDIEIGKHGLLIQQGHSHGLLLPQVPVERHWDSFRFLEETCEKAGLSRMAWKSPGTRILGFTAEIFSEAESAEARR
jgi:AmmeMemoRadiSam system protein A